jgi:hypothetical protein
MWGRRKKAKHRHGNGHGSNPDDVDMDAAPVMTTLTNDDCNDGGGARVRTLLHTGASTLPTAIAYDQVHHRLVWCEHRCVKYLNIADATIHLLAGQDSSMRCNQDDRDYEVDAIGCDARFGSLTGLAIVPSNGDIIVVDSDHRLIRCVNALTGQVTSIAGTPSHPRYSELTYNLTEEEAEKYRIPSKAIRSPNSVEAQFCQPFAIAIDSKGNIVVFHS